VSPSWRPVWPSRPRSVAELSGLAMADRFGAGGGGSIVLACG
jgi:hypothetical protein